MMIIRYHQFRLHIYIYIYIELMINLVYISNIWMNIFYHQSKYAKAGILYIYIYQIYHDYISHQSCISHLNDKPVYIYIYIYIYIVFYISRIGTHLLHLFTAAAAASTSSSSSRLLRLWWLSGSVVGFKVYIYMCVCVCVGDPIR